MHSIYHFFNHLVQNSLLLKRIEKLDDFPFDAAMLSCRQRGKFPDLAIRLHDAPPFTGGELVELKDSRSYTVASFNSTIPTGQKDISSIIKTPNQMRTQMEAAGDDILSLPVREVFYLVRGQRRGQVKVCLVHGSFFETIKAEDLIRQAFSQVLEERIAAEDVAIGEELKAALVAIFSDQSAFSSVRDVEQASVKLRFRIMTEAKRQGNILNAAEYPQIEDNTLNLIVPMHDEAAATAEREKVRLAVADHEQLEIFPIQHPLNGEFLVFQADLSAAR